MSPRLLVTGSRGFIGGHLMEGARRRDIDALGLHRDARAGVSAEEICVDLLDPAGEEALTRALRGVDAVIHAAAAVRLFGCHAPIVRENAVATSRLLRAAAAAGAPRIVFLSSASVLFRAREQRRMDEHTPLPRRFLSGYAASKARCEALVARYPGESVILRPQAVIGPGDRSLLPPILAAARSGRWAWIGPEGGALADLLSVQNLVQWALTAALEPGVSGVFHLSDGEPREVQGLLRGIFAQLGIDAGERRVPRAAALLAAGAAELPLRWLAPGREPPVTRFGIEVLSRTRTVDISRAVAVLGPREVSLEQDLKDALAAHGAAVRRP